MLSINSNLLKCRFIKHHKDRAPVRSVGPYIADQLEILALSSIHFKLYSELSF